MRLPKILAVQHLIIFHTDTTPTQVSYVLSTHLVQISPENVTKPKPFDKFFFHPEAKVHHDFSFLRSQQHMGKTQKGCDKY